MRKLSYSSLAILLVLVILPATVLAANSSENADIMRRFAASDSIRDSIKQGIADGLDQRLLVKTACEIGFNPCFVMRSAIEGGGNLGQVIAGANDAGVPPDVMAKCAKDAGAPTEDIAKAIQTAGMPGICYYRSTLASCKWVEKCRSTHSASQFPDCYFVCQ